MVTDVGTGVAAVVANGGTGVPRPTVSRRTGPPAPQRVGPGGPRQPQQRVVVKDATTAISDLLIPLVAQMLAAAESHRAVTPVQLQAFTAQYLEAVRLAEALQDQLAALEGELEVAADVLRYIGGGE